MSETILKKVLSSKSICYIIIISCACLIMAHVRYQLEETKTIKNIELVPKHLQGLVRFSEKYVCRDPDNMTTAAALRSVLEQRNREHEVRNMHAYGPVSRHTPVLVVTAARDPARLQYLIVSLAQVHDIHTAILIFSHSFYDESIDDLIRSITFCMVKQIYFPNSVQLFPKDFPGSNQYWRGDETETGSEAEPLLFSPREPRRAERKHHWWWTAHAVFERTQWARAHRGMVLFLEEDSYVLPDLLHVLRRAAAALQLLPTVQLVALGRPPGRRLATSELILDAWRPAFARGLAFNATVWRTIKELAGYFCQYDDVSWSYSLAHALSHMPRGAAVMLASTEARVLATGGWGGAGVRLALEFVAIAKRTGKVFPARMTAVALWGRGGALYRREPPAPRGNGGWEDARDILLCLEPMFTTTTDEDDLSTITPVFTAT